MLNCVTTLFTFCWNTYRWNMRKWEKFCLNFPPGWIMYLFLYKILGSNAIISVLKFDELSFTNSSIDTVSKYDDEEIDDVDACENVYFLFSLSFLQPAPIWCIMPESQYVLAESAQLYALRAHVPTCLACLRTHVPTCLACVRAHVSCVITCSRANVSCVLTC